MVINSRTTFILTPYFPCSLIIIFWLGANGRPLYQHPWCLLFYLSATHTNLLPRCGGVGRILLSYFRIAYGKKSFGARKLCKRLRLFIICLVTWLVLAIKFSLAVRNSPGSFVLWICGYCENILEAPSCF